MTKQAQVTAHLPAEAPSQLCVDGTPIQISFREDGRPLQDILRSYFLQLKQDSAAL